MLDVPKIYNDPVIMRKRRGDAIEPYVEIKESIVLDSRARASLTEIPNRYAKVKVTKGGEQLFEIEHGFLEENTFKVDYVNGVVYFHESLANQTLNFEYQGEGVYLIPDSRIYLTGDKYFSTARDKFADIDRAILVERRRIDTQLLSHPQPSEIMDVRVDRNGKVFRVAKDRIDAEQKKIEEAYIDAFGVRHSSLKDRIDSLQLATERKISDLEEGIIDMQALISVIPDKIELKVNEVREDLEGRITTLTGEISVMSDLIELKVSKDDIISSINLSSEGVRIDGSKHHITGETLIDNGVIKSAHIESLSASKIDAGVINTSLISIKDEEDKVIIDRNGVTINNGAITIRRPDGFSFVQNGIAQFDYAVEAHEPPYTDPQVKTSGYFWRITELWEHFNLQFYTVKKTGRYLKLWFVHGMLRTPGSGGIWIYTSGADQRVLASVIFDNHSLDYDNNETIITIDMGEPDGSMFSFFVKGNLRSSNNEAQIRKKRIWVEG